MTTFHKQQCTRFSKINHAYFFIDAVRRKDYLNVCRHFLWQMNRQNNQPLTQKSIVATIAGLTLDLGLDKQRIENVISGMSKAGEIERYKGISNRVGWNPDVTNQIRWSQFNSEYKGNSIRAYNEKEEKVIAELLKMSDAVPYMPRDMEDFTHTIEIEENTVLKEKVQNLEDKIQNLEESFRAFKEFCEQKFKASEIQDWFREHGGLEVVKS